MAILDLYSKRQRAALGPSIDVFKYDAIPNGVRVQVIHILGDVFGDANRHNSETSEIWRSIHVTLAREYGRFQLGGPRDSDFKAVANHFLANESVDQVLDFIELSFRIVNRHCRQESFRPHDMRKDVPDEAIAELNARLLESGIGYSFVENQIIRKDSELLHQSIILPVLKLLHDARFSGANEEYLSAHMHYRNARYKECLNDCLKSFESTIKTICKIKGWTYSDKDTAKTLIDICFKNNLIPSFLQSEFGSLRSALEGGIPTVRNKLGGHGQGPNPVDVPSYFASYLLNLTASTIVFLVEAATC